MFIVQIGEYSHLVPFTLNADTSQGCSRIYLSYDGGSSIFRTPHPSRCGRRASPTHPDIPNIKCITYFQGGWGAPLTHPPNRMPAPLPTPGHNKFAAHTIGQILEQPSPKKFQLLFFSFIRILHVLC